MPEVRLTKEDLEGDPIELLMKLEKKYEEFGAVKLITPPEWAPPFSFRYSDQGITTRIQHLHKLKNGKVVLLRDSWLIPNLFFLILVF